MSDSRDDDLNFDRAEFEPTAGTGAGAENAAQTGDADPTVGATCRVCQQAIASEYYSLPGADAAFCVRCRDAFLAQHGPSMRGARVIRAVTAGFFAGIAGCLLYYAVAKVTGYEIGLVAVVVGFMVGGAVRWGSFGRGGFAYQFLAVGITYMAIVGTSIPTLLEAIQNDPTFEEERRAAEENRGRAKEPVSAIGMIVGVGLLAALALSMPILSAFDAPIWLLIIGFAVFEAWKRNRRMSLDFEGPFRLGASTGVPPASGAAT